jgi:hypothetical protein
MAVFLPMELDARREDTAAKSERETKRARVHRETKLCRGTSFSLALSVGWFVSTQRSLTLHKCLQARSDEYWKCSPVLGFSSSGSTASGCVFVFVFSSFFSFLGLPFFIQRFLFYFPADRCLSRRPLAPLSLAPSLSTGYISFPCILFY